MNLSCHDENGCLPPLLHTWSRIRTTETWKSLLPFVILNAETSKSEFGAKTRTRTVPNMASASNSLAQLFIAAESIAPAKQSGLERPIRALQRSRAKIPRPPQRSRAEPCGFRAGLERPQWDQAGKTCDFERLREAERLALSISRAPTKQSGC